MKKRYLVPIGILVFGLMFGCTTGKIEGQTPTYPERTATPTFCVEENGVFCLETGETLVCDGEDLGIYTLTNVGKTGRSHGFNMKTVIDGQEISTTPPITEDESLNVFELKKGGPDVRVTLDGEILRVSGGTGGCERE